MLSTTGSLASTLGTVQPFRYRGYVYDVETGLYYLKSRYYKPENGRFLNADNQIRSKENDKETFKNADFSNLSYEGAEYQTKTNGVNDRLKNLW